jgi:hypothetical protein
MICFFLSYRENSSSNKYYGAYWGYTSKQLCGITEELVSQHWINGRIAKVIAEMLWSKSGDVRDCVKISTLAKTMTHVEASMLQAFV